MKAPDVERLPEVATLPLETMSAGEVHNPCNAEGAVFHEAAQRRGRTLELALQEVVDQDNRFVKIPYKIANAIAPARREHSTVALGDRLQQDPIDSLIECKSLPIKRLQRIVVCLVGSEGDRVPGRSGASGKNEQQSATTEEL
jgi:hypothetical protein